MKLYQIPGSPFVRIAKATAYLKGLTGRLELINRTDAGIQTQNPLNKVPTLVTNDGETLIESRLIAQYLDEIGGGARLYPSNSKARRAVLQREAVVLGVLDAAVLRKMEMRRPEAQRSEQWDERQRLKIQHGLDLIEAHIQEYTDTSTIIPVELGCLLGYLDRDFPDYDWRTGRIGLPRWWETYRACPAMVETYVGSGQAAGKAR
ncbi:MAG: glutathione S-transferase [Alphaproteobacteria bacterium]|nr:glutathione S-transferase [Alphaproteobacteria bacterium]